MQRAAHSKYFRSMQQQALFGKKKKKDDPLLNHDIHTCGSVCLFIYRGATWIRRGAGNERRHQRKGEDDNGMNNGAIKQEKDMPGGGEKS